MKNSDTWVVKDSVLHTVEVNKVNWSELNWNINSVSAASCFQTIGFLFVQEELSIIDCSSFPLQQILLDVCVVSAWLQWMCKRSSMKSLLTVFCLRNGVTFACCQLWPRFDLLFWPVHFCNYHRFLEMLFLNNGFRKNHKRNAAYLNPFRAGGPIQFVLKPRLQTCKTQLFHFTRVHIDISFHFS